MNFRHIGVAAVIAVNMVPSIAAADACSDYHIARAHRDAVDVHINAMDQDYLMTQEGVDMAHRLTDEADGRLEVARGAVRHTLQNDSGAALTVDTLTELDFLASREMRASWMWVRESDRPPPRALQIKVLSIMSAIEETRDEVFKALCP